MEDNTVLNDAAAPTDLQEDETLAGRMEAAGLTKEEISEALRDVLKEMAPASPTPDIEQAEREYFNSFIRR